MTDEIVTVADDLQFKDKRVLEALQQTLIKGKKLTPEEQKNIKSNFELYLLIGNQGNDDKTRLIVAPGRIEDLLDFSNTVSVFKFGILRDAKGDSVSFVHVGYAMITPQMLGEPQTDKFDIRLIPVVLLVHSTKMARNLGYKVNLFKASSPKEIENKLNNWSSYLISYILPKLQVAVVQKNALTKAYNEETFDMLRHAQEFAFTIINRVLQNPKEYEESWFDRLLRSLSENWKAWAVLGGLLVAAYAIFTLF